MRTSQTSLVLGIVLFAGAGCDRLDTPEASESALLIPAQTGVWEGVSYGNSCADQCELVRGKSPCWCIGHPCPGGDPDGQSCSPIGTTCNVIGSSSYEVLDCELPTPPPPTWHLTRSTTCYQYCGVNNCNCLTICPAGTASGQPCSPSGAQCEVLTNLSTGLVQELTCTP